MVSEPEAERRSIDPRAPGTEMSPDPDDAWNSPACNDLTNRSPEPDLAESGQRASPTTMSPDPLLSRAELPLTVPTDGIEEVVVNAATGQRSSAACSGTRVLPFATGYGPLEEESCPLDRVKAWLGVGER